MGQLFERRRFTFERLIGLYADFSGVVSDDLARANEVNAALCHGAPASRTDEEGFSQWVAYLAKVDSPRHEHCKNLARLAFQLRILDRDQGTTDLVQKVRQSQPWFFYHPFILRRDAWESDTRRSQEDDYKRNIAAYSSLLEQLVEAVGVKYGNRSFSLRSLARRWFARSTSSSMSSTA